jgi:hypothetical protein
MRKVLIAMLATLPAIPAQAGTRAVYEERDERRTMTFEIDDEGNFRAGREDQYRLVHETEVFQVAEVDGIFYVARIEDLAAARKETTSGLLRAAAKTFTFLGGEGPQQWERRGRKTINGWEGREYKLLSSDRAFDEDYDPFEEMEATTVVVSDDPALEPLGDAMLHYTADEMYLKRHFISGRSANEVLESLDGLARLGTVIASEEGDIRLLSAEEADIDPERLALPAEPMTRAEIVALIREKRNPFKL